MLLRAQRGAQKHKLVEGPRYRGPSLVSPQVSEVSVEHHFRTITIAIRQRDIDVIDREDEDCDQQTDYRKTQKRCICSRIYGRPGTLAIHRHTGQG